MSEDIKAKSLNIENLVDYQKDTVVSREVIDGEAEITISGNKNIVKKGEMIIMPANEPHALQAVNMPYKMILTMIKSD